MKFLAPCALGLLWFAGCATQPTLPAGSPIGEAIAPQEIVPFAAVDEAPESYFERTVLVEATATEVCQSKGCWMQVEDDGRTAMVKWETGCGGKYAFPKDLAGKRVVIQGTFYPKQLTQEEVDHLAADLGGKEIEVRKDGYEFNASAILILADTP